MTYLLDTNACIVYLNGHSETLKQRFLSCRADQLLLCSIVKAELFFGAMKSQNPVKSNAKIQAFFSQFNSVAFDDNAAEWYGKIRADLSAKGTPIGHNDLLIAATALTHQLTLITHNTREFSRVEQLQMADWEV